MVIKYIRKLLGVRNKAKAESEAAAPTPPPERPNQPAVHHRPIPNEQIDPDAAKILKRLHRFGHTAYIVGGGVRDLLLQRTPKDFDIGTSARPNEVRKLFRNCRIIGRRFRLAHIFFHDKIIEVATFRSNQPEDLVAAAAEEALAALARRAGGGVPVEPPQIPEKADPADADFLIRSDNVFGTPETDALRRDFTINALFYDIETGNVIDYVDGIADLDAHVLRTIGDPEVRMREDPIRILRAARLAGRLGFKIDQKTVEAIRRHKEDIHRAAPPRILEDLLRMLRGSGAEGAFTLMRELGVDKVVLPELLAATRPGDPELQAKTLHSLDLATTRGTEFSNATLLSLSFYPVVRRALDAVDGDDTGPALAALDRVLTGFEQRLIVPKRDRDRIRQILLAQPRFLPSHRGKRFSASAFIRKPVFPEAFDLFDIVASATGENRDEVRRWKGRITSVAMATDGEALGPEIPSGDAHGETEGGRRRRRRGGRGRARPEGVQASHGHVHEPAGRRPSAPHGPPEPMVLPDLAPGENPYGDAIAVPLPSGPSRSGGRRSGGQGSHSSSPSGHHQASTGGTASGLAGHSGGEGRGAGGGGRKRRRRGGRGRKRGGQGGASTGGAPPSGGL